MNSPIEKLFVISSSVRFTFVFLLIFIKRGENLTLGKAFGILFFINALFLYI